GVSPSALRLWERQDLVRPRRSPAGYRLYGEEDVERLRQVRRMRDEQVNAPGIRRILARTARLHDGVPASGLDGRRLRQLRVKRGLSLRQAGLRAGLSASYLSSLERDAAGVTLATLQQLTRAYGATVLDLFQPSVARGRHVRSAERPVLELDEAGVRIEQLARDARLLEPQLFVLAPGASSDGTYSHDGEEFLYVLDGGLTVWVGDRERYRLAAGDALTYPSTLPHRWRNRAGGETRLLWINTPPTF
ncbi:MAG: cupin domain-containing protein, partial [Candidatus Limnocylindria bacterium]